MKNRLLLALLAAGALLSRPVFGVTQLVQNGQFSTLNPQSGWTVSVNGTTTSTGLSFVGGNPGFVTMGGGVVGPGQQLVYTPVAIPTNVIFAQYSFVFSAASFDPSKTAVLSAVVLDPTATLQLADVDNEFNGFTSATQRTINLSAFIGQTVNLGFEVQVGAGATNSVFDVTDVSLLAFTAGDIPPNDFFTNSTLLGSVSKTNIIATNILATFEPGESPISKNASSNTLWWAWTAPSNGVVTINTAGSDFNTLLGVFVGDTLASLVPLATDSSGANSQVKIPVATGVTYRIDVDGKNGANGVISLNLSFVPDTTKPAVTVKTPASNAKLTNSTVQVTGTASDNVAVGFVTVQLVNAAGSNEVLIANGTNTWSATVTNLIPGLNTLLVQAFDTSSNASPVQKRTVNFTVVSPLTVTVIGTGSVTPDLTKTPQAVGSTLTLTAKPGTGEVLSSWSGTGGLFATTPTISFTMQSNMMLQVTFVPNPFLPVVGNYQGLFYDTGAPAHENAGFFNATVASTGSFTSKLILAGKSYSLSGQFAAGGEATATLVRKGLSTVTAQLQLNLDGSGIVGTLSDGTFTSQLFAMRPMSNAAALAGRYNVFLPGVASGMGASYGSVTVTSTGGLTLVGVLADDTKAAQKTSVLADGMWPFYVPLYSGTGSIFGWITFSNQPETDLIGGINWTKPAQAKAKFYAGGFTNSVNMLGSLYTNAAPVLNFESGMVLLQGGNLTNSIQNSVTLGADNKVTNNSPNPLTLTITPTTGAFKGTALNPATGKSQAFTGVVIQKMNEGEGFFLGTTNSGSVLFAPVPF